jgi:creatinine amidohydrolase
MIRKLADLTHHDFDALVPQKIDAALLPIGTIEAHGCTNLGTDNTIPEYLCEKLADKMNMLIAPTIPYGITRTLLPYPGSITLSPQTFEALVTDVLVSLFMNGFQKTIVINGHGGNNAQIERAAAIAWEKTGGYTLIIHWWQLCAPVTEKIFGQAGGHAGLDETAMVMAADKKLVKAEQCKKVAPYLVQEGSYAYPNPSPILLYKDGEGAPVFDERKAQKYADAVVQYLQAFIEDVFKKWEINLGE